MSNVIAKGISASLTSGEKETIRNNIDLSAASKVEMETGTETALRSMSPLRVKEAIDANAPTPTIASTAEAEAGTNNTNFLTPLRLRDGVNATGSAPIFAARAWVNFDGTTAGTNPASMTIRASGNVSSVTRTSTGIYRINFTTAMPDANYAAIFDSGTTRNTTETDEFETTYAEVHIKDGSAGSINQLYVSCAIFR
jgi:hypothetical protein